MAENKVVVVVLNYLNYLDTKECVDSILQQEVGLAGIVIVDNGSTNGSLRYLKNSYRNNDKVYILSLENNVGYAQGNNQGISYARRKLKTDFVLVANNDTIFQDRKYIQKLINRYEIGTGILFSKVRMLNGEFERKIYANLKAPWIWLEYVTLWLQRIHLYYYADRLKSMDHGEKTMLLKGCAFLLTPDFFGQYEGFYPRTFLFYEETLLHLMCKRYNLRIERVKEAEIIHKKYKSSEMSFRNDFQVRMHYYLKSYKYVLWNWLLNQIHCFRFR